MGQFLEEQKYDKDKVFPVSFPRDVKIMNSDAAINIVDSTNTILTVHNISRLPTV